MNRAIAYGLMGAATGLGAGLYDEWDQRQKDMRSEQLDQAQYQEKVQLLKLQQQFNSQANVAKVNAQLQANMTRDAANNQSKSDLQTQKEQSDAQQGTLDRSSREKIAAGNNASMIQAQNIRATADDQPRSLADATYIKPDGSYTVVRGGDTPPLGSRLVVTAGGSIGPYQRRGAKSSAADMGGNDGVSPTVPNPASSDVSGAAGGAPTQPAPSLTVGKSPYPDGTQLNGPNGTTYVVRNGVPVPAGQ